MRRNRDGGGKLMSLNDMSFLKGFECAETLSAVTNDHSGFVKTTVCYLCGKPITLLPFRRII